jgi:hypothetical protein
MATSFKEPFHTVLKALKMQKAFVHFGAQPYRGRELRRTSGLAEAIFAIDPR